MVLPSVMAFVQDFSDKFHHISPPLLYLAPSPSST